MNIYTCAVCGGEYREEDVAKTTCIECESAVCIYCVEFDGKNDVCDKCVDEKMFKN